MASRTRVSPVDTAWLRMDRPSNLMMIVGVMMLEGKTSLARMRSLVEHKLLRYRRLRQRVVENVTGYYWEDDDAFDIAHHVEPLRLPAPADKHALTTLVSELASRPLDMRRPLWQWHYVTNYVGGPVLIARYHHSIADGIALIRVLMSLTDDSPSPPRSRKPLPEINGDDEEPHPEGLWSQVLEPVSGALTEGMRIGGRLLEGSRSLVAHPGQARDYLLNGALIAAEVGRLLLMPPDSPTRFKGKPGGNKRVAWSEPLRLDEAKVIGKALGCSLNDVLLSAVAGALRQYLVEQGDAVGGVELRALVPVNLRPPEDERMGNHFGLVALELPVGIENPLARVAEVNRRMKALRGSWQAPVTLTLLGAAGIVPQRLQETFLDMLAARASAVMTNVPGPQTSRWLAGARLAQPMFWVPQSGDIGMGVSILTYDGKVQFGLVTDAELVPDPENAVDRFGAEFEKLLYCVLLDPWNARRDPTRIERDVTALLKGEALEEEPETDGTNPAATTPEDPPAATPPQPDAPAKPRRRAPRRKPRAATTAQRPTE